MKKNIKRKNLEQSLKNIQLECLVNSFVMFESVKNIKQKNEISRKISYGINLSVVIFTLLSLYLVVTKVALWFEFADVFLSLLAFGFSIAIFLFRKDGDPRIDYSIANSYWILYKKIQDIVYNLENGRKIKKVIEDFEIIKGEHRSLIRISPVFKAENYKKAIENLKQGHYIYATKDERHQIKEFVQGIC